MQDNKNRFPVNQPMNINRPSLSRQPPQPHRPHSGHYSHSKPPTSNYIANNQQQDSSQTRTSQFRQQFQRNTFTSGFHTYSHRMKQQNMNQYESWKNKNSFHEQTINNANSYNTPTFVPRRNVPVNTRERKNSEVIFPTSYCLENFGQAEMDFGNKDFRKEVRFANSNSVHQNANGEDFKRFQKPEVFQSMIIQNTDKNRKPSITKMKNSVIRTNYSSISSDPHQFKPTSPPDPYKLQPSIPHHHPTNPSPIHSTNNNPPSQISKLKMTRTDSYEKEQDHHKNDSIKQSSIFGRNLEMKQSCMVVPRNSNENSCERENAYDKFARDLVLSPKNSFLKKNNLVKTTNSRGETPNKQDNSANRSNQLLKMLKKPKSPYPQEQTTYPKSPLHPPSHHPSEQPTQNQSSLNHLQKISKIISPANQFKKRSPQFVSTYPISFPTSPTTTGQHSELVAGSRSVQPRKLSMDDFEVIEKLGKGAFGDVFLVQEKLTKFICVLKILNKNRIKQQNLQQHVLRQVKIQSYLNHKNLVQLYGVFDDQKKIYLIMEYLNDGTLSSNKKKITQSETAYIIKQVLDGLIFMHFQNIIHRDLKPDNLLMFESYVKIGDFGCSVYSNSMRKTVVGCLAYISPEQLNQSAYDEKIDVWSVGVLTYQLIMGKSPFQEDLKKMAKIQYHNRLTSDSDNTNLQGSQFPQLKFPQNTGVSEQAQDFIKNLLNQNPDQRMTVKQASKHKFIQKSQLWEKTLEQKFQG